MFYLTTPSTSVRELLCGSIPLSAATGVNVSLICISGAFTHQLIQYRPFGAVVPLQPMGWKVLGSYLSTGSN